MFVLIFYVLQQKIFSYSKFFTSVSINRPHSIKTKFTLTFYYWHISLAYFHVIFITPLKTYKYEPTYGHAPYVLCQFYSNPLRFMCFYECVCVCVYAASTMMTKIPQKICTTCFVIPAHTNFYPSFLFSTHLCTYFSSVLPSIRNIFTFLWFLLFHAYFAAKNFICSCKHPIRKHIQRES